MELDLKNLNLAIGQQLTVEGKIPANCTRFEIDLGSDSQNFALHFNPRWDDPGEGTIIVINSKTKGNWDSNEDKVENTLQRDSTVKIVIQLKDKNNFMIQLPNKSIRFPNHKGMNIDYFRIHGDFLMKSFQM
ncbi:beta-galactoside-binding lectin-like [Osmerus eperlanus]|uniref:beta-galactoside-binding lectin-like n=1 Tax=Osmerus eperlanus TaxID=29151 RepID=UPI002E0F5E78